MEYFQGRLTRPQPGGAHPEREAGGRGDDLLDLPGDRVAGDLLAPREHRAPGPAAEQHFVRRQEGEDRRLPEGEGAEAVPLPERDQREPLLRGAGDPKREVQPGDRRVGAGGDPVPHGLPQVPLRGQEHRGHGQQDPEPRLPARLLVQPAPGHRRQ